MANEVPEQKRLVLPLISQMVAGRSLTYDVRAQDAQDRSSTRQSNLVIVGSREVVRCA
jgi:hypothetical protein